MSPLTFSEIVAAVEPSIMTRASNHCNAVMDATAELVRLGFEDRGIPADILNAVVRMTRKEGGCPEHVLTGPIDHAWLTAVGIHEFENEHTSSLGHGEYSARIEGGVPGGRTCSSEDQDGDEIAKLVIYLEESGRAVAYIETYEHPTYTNLSITMIGPRTTRAEVLQLCRALKAWAIVYPEGF